MIEKEYITLFEKTPDKAETFKKPVLLKIGFIFSLLGLFTPFLVFLVARLGMRLPCCGEDSNPADGLGWMLVMIAGIMWWTTAEMISIAFTVSGLVRKETGRIKIVSVAASALSLILIVSVYVGAYALVRHVQNETERYQSTRKI